MSKAETNADATGQFEQLASEIAAGLPDGWQLRSLGDLCEKSQYGWTTKADREGTGVKFLRTTDITPGFVEWESVPYCLEVPSDLEKYLIREGDLLISRAGSIGYSYLVSKPELAVFASYLIRFRPKAEVSAKYLRYYLQSPTYWRAIGTGKLGIAVQNVNATTLSQIPVPVAPLSAQSEIVAEIEKQFSRLDEAVANLKRVKANLKRYKAAVLKAAFEGRLVPTEAELAQIEGRTGATGRDLVQHILERRRKELNGKANYNQPVTLENTIAPNLPPGWVWSSLGQCFRVVVGATPSRKEASYWNGDIPWVSSSEVQFGRVSKTKERITLLGHKNSSTQINPVGSVLIGMIGQGPTRGQSAILDIDASNNQNCAAIWVSRTPVPPEYVFYWLMERYNETRSEGSGNNQQALNKNLVEKIPLPLPPIVEQIRIVAEIERQMSLIGGLEIQTAASLKRAERLRQTILAKTFSPLKQNG